MKKIIIIASVILTSIILSACGNTLTDLEYIETQDEFILGFTDFPPMGYNLDGNPSGFDIEVAKLVFERMDIKLKFKYIDWDAKVVELDSRRIDAIWNGLTITDERKLEMQFSKPYFDNNLIILSKLNSGINSISDLENKNIGLENSSSADIATSKNEAITSTVKEIKKYTTSNDAVLSLNAGQVDAVIVDEIYARYVVMKDTNNTYQISDEKIGNETYGIGFRKGDVKLQEKIDSILDELYEEGLIQPISIKYFGVDLFIRG
ncbi:amino acid ABC transporter substrate-binding protein [Acholeplasma granularum]|uniref:amino acid ABC transporter substrate-binding protein n=1 Tax=Acholeplasma granularum TaxID=264635 RepID=UPI00046FFF01|nr:amino acid ABC transporter substrate-binding protein [Acholeplasma granularum]